MTLRDKIIEAYPLASYLEATGRHVERKAGQCLCLCPFHDDHHPSLRIEEKKGLWICDPCHIGGTVIDLAVRLTGGSVKFVMLELAEKKGLITDEDRKPHRTATYAYKNPYGQNVMFVDRTEATGGKKTFSQYRQNDAGQRINSVAGVQKVLYRLERWSGKPEVALCEGEKCVHALESVGIDATTNPGGSSGWIAAYAHYLKDKHVDIWPDNDEPGNKWLASVLSSLEGKVASLRVLRVEAIYGDVADLIDAQGAEIALETMSKLMSATVRIDRGMMLPLLSSAECYELYRKRINSIEEEGVDLGCWLPSLRIHSRILLPGDMVVFMSDTGVGKTCALANIAYSCVVPTIIFELELAAEALCERFISREHNIETLDVERETRRGVSYTVDGWGHVFICPQSKLTIGDMEGIIGKAELKMQSRPRLILVDYIGLMAGESGKRYERMSSIAESMKILAKSTETVVVCASQIRRDPDRQEVDLHDAKDSGSVENSAQLVLGAWRPSEDRISIRVLKNTKRAGIHTINCHFDGHRQRITEILDETKMASGY